jgi:hypothetical protein
MTSPCPTHPKGAVRRFGDAEFRLNLTPEVLRAVESVQPGTLVDLSLAALARDLWDYVSDLDGYRSLSPRLLYQFYGDPARPLLASHLLAQQLGRRVKHAVVEGPGQSRLRAAPPRLTLPDRACWELSYRYLHLRVASEMHVCDSVWGEVLHSTHTYFFEGLQYEIECLCGVLDRRRRDCTCSQCRMDRRYRPREEYPYDEYATGRAVSLVYIPGLSVPTRELGLCVEKTLSRERSRRRAEAMRGPLREWVELSERTKPLLDEAGRRFYQGDFRLWREADRELATPVARMAELSRRVCEIQGGGDEFWLRDRLWDGLLKRAEGELYPGAAAFTALYY